MVCCQAGECVKETPCLCPTETLNQQGTSSPRPALHLVTCRQKSLLQQGLDWEPCTNSTASYEVSCIPVVEFILSWFALNHQTHFLSVWKLVAERTLESLSLLSSKSILESKIPICSLVFLACGFATLALGQISSTLKPKHIWHSRLLKCKHCRNYYCSSMQGTCSLSVIQEWFG